MKISKFKIITGLLLLFIVAVYNSNFMMFKVINAIDDKTQNTFQLGNIRNNIMKMVDDMNPLKGSAWTNKDKLPVLNFSLTKKKLKQISSTVINAKKMSPYAYYMPNEVNNFIKTKVIINGEKYSAKIKLHGTNNPHFLNNKKSYSVKIRKNKNKAYPYNMRRFSLVIPSQSNLIGMFTYKIANMLGMLTPKNFLVRMYINGIDQGVYHLEEKLNKSLLERNNMSGYDVVRSDDSWAHQYSNNHGTMFSFDYSGLNLKYISGKDLDQIVPIKKILNSNDISYIKQHVDIDKFISYDVLRYIFGDSAHMTSNDNIKLLFNTATARVEPYFRIENHIDKIVENKLSYSPEQHVNIGKYTVNNLLLNLTMDDSYREKRNRAIFKILTNKDNILRVFDEIVENKLGILINDTSNEVPTSYFKYEMDDARDKLIHNFNFLQKYLNYSRVFVEFIRKNKEAHEILIKPDSNAPIAAKVFKIYVDKSHIGKDVKIQNIKTQKTYYLEVGAGKGEGVIDLMEVFENSVFSLSLDNLLEPSKKIYKYSLQFRGKINKSKIIFYNDLSKKLILNRDLYSVIVDESNYIEPGLPSFVEKIDENTYQVMQGTHIVSNDIVFPSGVNLVINKGVTIKLKKGASLLINGGLSVNGSEESPIKIINNEANEIFGSIGVIGDGASEVNISFLEIYGGSEDVVNGIHLSGALSIHNHKSVTIENSRVHHNSADDGVNIKNANFLVRNNKFYANKADQIDIDFGEGEVINNHFSQLSLVEEFDNVKIPKDDNGDGLDLSGSQVLIIGNIFEGFLDKGMSIGENTKAFVLENKFKKNRSAITSKDQSQVYIKNNDYLDNKIDIEMYQKKKIFNHPSVFNLSENINNLMIKKTTKSKYYKAKSSLDDVAWKLDESIFRLLESISWIEYE